MTINNTIRLNRNEMPAVILGSTFIDLRRIAEYCNSRHNLDIEFYEERNSNINRFFVGRDFSSGTNQEILEDGIDYRIELCECMPQLNEIRSLEDLESLFREESESNLNYLGIPEQPVITRPNFRVYRYRIRPPFAEELVFETTINDNDNMWHLSALIIRYVRYHDRDLPDTIKESTSFVDNGVKI